MITNTTNPNTTSTVTYSPATSDYYASNWYPWGYPYYPQQQVVDRTGVKWKCGNCGSSCSGYFSAEYAAEGLVKHQRTCKAKP